MALLAKNSIEFPGEHKIVTKAEQSSISSFNFLCEFQRFESHLGEKLNAVLILTALK